MAVNDDDPNIVLAVQSTLVPHIDCCATVDQKYSFKFLGKHGQEINTSYYGTCDGCEKLKLIRLEACASCSSLILPNT